MTTYFDDVIAGKYLMIGNRYLDHFLEDSDDEKLKNWKFSFKSKPKADIVNKIRLLKLNLLLGFESHFRF